MNTFLAFRTAVVSVSKQRVPATQLLSRSQQRRFISATRKTEAKFNKNEFLLAQSKKAEEPKRKSDGPLKDENIGYQIVQINHEGQLSSPTSVSYILSLLDRRGYYIRLISHDPPIVKIVNKAEEYQRKREERGQAKLLKAKQAHKELQLSWATSNADVARKVEKAREDLVKGHRVDLVIAHKKGHPYPSPREVQQKLQNLVDSLADVGKEWRERIARRGLAAVFLQGIKPSGSTQEEDDSRAEEDEEDGQDAPTSQKKSKYAVDPIPEEIWDLFR